MCAYHTPVLLQESIVALAIKPGGVYVDATFGGGGHSRAILEQLGPKGLLLGFDQDTDSLANAPADKRFKWVHGNFRFVHNFCKYLGYEQVDGILADLGVSSHQFDTDSRGFSFRFDGDLDMRMNQQAALTAATVLNTYSPERLEQVFRDYAELPNARSIAQRISTFRDKGTPIRTTEDFRQALGTLIPKVADHKFLAKIYQALRIEVNGEMNALSGFLGQCLSLLKPQGRLVIITYHSLEDRMVKVFIRQACLDNRLVAITKKPLVPSEEEISSNTRARSAKLRVAAGVSPNGQEVRL